MVPRTRNFNNTRPRGLTGKGNSAAPPNNFTITEKVLGTATEEIFFSPKKAPLVTL